jgi:hypothetical protein
MTSDALTTFTRRLHTKNHDVQKLSESLANLNSIDFLGRARQHALPARPARKHCWLYMPIEENRNFCLAVFGLRSGQRLPMHNHPQMTVLMRPLFGQIRIRSFFSGERHGDFLTVEDERVVVLDECTGVVNVGVDSGDIHEITAITDCAFADLVYPPYDDHGERCVSYFEQTNDSNILKQIPEPKDNCSIRLKTWV